MLGVKVECLHINGWERRLHPTQSWGSDKTMHPDSGGLASLHALDSSLRYYGSFLRNLLDYSSLTVAK